MSRVRIDLIAAVEHPVSGISAIFIYVCSEHINNQSIFKTLGSLFRSNIPVVDIYLEVTFLLLFFI